jgi:hypothetical protein
MYMKKYDAEMKIMVAVCDREIIGKIFREGDLVLKLDEGFYKGDEVSEREVKEALSGAAIANLAGEQSVACAVDCGCIDPENIIFIEGVPHAQMVRI